MQLSYRGRHHTPAASEVPTAYQPFEGQFLGVTSTLNISYSNSTPNMTISLMYRGQDYLGDR